MAGQKGKEEKRPLMCEISSQRMKRRKEYFMKYYSTKSREKAIFALVVGVIMIILAVWFAFFVPVEQHTAPDAIYPMANQNITWEGAGYDGIWGGAK